MGTMEQVNPQKQSTSVKVLIADDDAPTRILLRAAISQWGYTVVEASDGEDAWEVLQQGDAPKLMIVDWLMPRLDGIDLCRRIKHELKEHPYIILLTQLTGTTNIVKGLEAGANEFLSKPFNMAELQSRLSVGKRIVEYGESLDHKNKELKAYLDEANDLSQSLRELSQKIEKIIGSPDNLDKNTCLQYLHELQNDIKCNTEKMASLLEAHAKNK